MNRFNCEDCVLNRTDACRYGANKSNDYSDTCPDLFVEQNHAYEQGKADKEKELLERIKELENRVSELESACSALINGYA